MFAREIRLFCTAWMFFTRLPQPARLAAWVGHGPELSGAATRYLPLIGVFVGLAGAAVYALGFWLFTPMVAVALSMAATVLLTGAIHEDGFADVCDGFGGGTSPRRVLEIMKDSRIGAFGAIGTMLLLLVRFAALDSLAEGAELELMTWLLVAGHALSRAAPVALIRCMTYARPEPDAKARPLAEAVSTSGLVVALALGMLPLLALGWFYDNGWLFVLGIVPVALATGLLGAWFNKRIGGYTGDCLGATQQVAEVVFYLYAVGLLAVPAAQ